MHLSRLYVAPEEQVSRIQVIDSARTSSIGDDPAILTGRAQSPDRTILSEQQFQHGDILGATFIAPVENVTGCAMTRVRAIGVVAQLLAETPFGALVPICAKEGTAG
jgi:hypothetical protein